MIALAGGIQACQAHSSRERNGDCPGVGWGLFRGVKPQAPKICPSIAPRVTSIILGSFKYIKKIDLKFSSLNLKKKTRSINKTHKGTSRIFFQTVDTIRLVPG